MTPAHDPKQLFFMITSRVHSVRRRLCICISVQQEASGRHHIRETSGGIWRQSGDQSLETQSWQVIEKEYWVRTPEGEASEESARQPAGGNTEEGILKK